MFVQKCQAILNKGFRIVVDKFSAFASSISSAVNKTRIGLLGSDRIGLAIRLKFPLKMVTWHPPEWRWRREKYVYNLTNLVFLFFFYCKVISLFSEPTWTVSFSEEAIEQDQFRREWRWKETQNHCNERYVHLCPPSSIRATSRDQASFWNCNRMKLYNRKFPRAVQLKIILCDDFQADGEF